ncbi:hypothetical protein Tco_1416150, partial [Tanacetum coccineum]
MGTIYDMNSILTQTAVDALCEKYHIPATIHHQLLGPNHRICDSLLWNDSFFWVDASTFPLFVPWHNNKTLRKDPLPKPTEFNAEVCDFLATHTAPFHKFPEPFLCLVGISRYYELDENVYPVFLTDDDEEMDLFAFINHADPTKVRICEKQIEEGQTPLLESTRGRVDERVNIVADKEVEATVADKPKGPRKKRKTTRDACGSGLPPKKLREDHGTSGVSTGGKSVAELQSLMERSTLAVEVGVTSVSTVPFVTSSMTLTLERERGGRTDSITGPNLRTQHLAKRFVVHSDSPCHSSLNAADAEVSFVVRSLIPDPPTMTTVVATTVFADTSSVPVHRAGDEPVHVSIFTDSISIGMVGPDIAGPSQPTGTDLSVDTFYLSQDMDSEMLRQIYVPKWNVVNEYALDDPDFNVGAARHTCLSAEVRMRTKHILREKKNLKGSCARQADLVKELSFDELNVKADSLESQKENLASQLSSLEATCVRLRDQISGYELFKEQYEAVQDEQVKILSDKVAGLDAELIGMALGTGYSLKDKNQAKRTKPSTEWKSVKKSKSKSTKSKSKVKDEADIEEMLNGPT